jgi:uncharacterized protein (TIGR03083 family)
VPVSFGTVYRGSFERIDARVRELATTDPAALDTPVPACPGWTVHGVVSHLCGIAVDALAGRLSGVPDDSWTAGQVDQRRGRPVEQVLDEWAPQVDVIAAALDARRMPVPPAADVLTHEGDIAEALGDPVPPEQGWRDAARLLCRGTVTRIDRPGTLTVRCGEDVWTGGAGDGPVASVEVEPWELFRAVFSRRSADQMRGWAWDGDPEPWLEPLCVFGLRRDDQPGCASPS